MRPKLLAIFATAVLLTGCKSPSAITPTSGSTPDLRPYLTFLEIAEKLDGASIPCSAKSEIDYEFEVVDCQNDIGDNPDAWLLKAYADKAELKEQKENNFCEWGGRTLIGENWIVWWDPSDAVLFGLQERLGGEIVSKSDWCNSL